MICQAAATQDEFWLCLYSQGHGDMELDLVLEAWNNRFAVYDDESETYRWIGKMIGQDHDGMWGTPYLDNNGYDLSASSIQEAVDKSVTVHYTSYVETPTGIIHLIHPEAEDVLGCTDVSASNYNTEATHENNSCVYNVDGCTNSNADNYDSEANTDDGSCSYPAVIDAEPLWKNPYLLGGGVLAIVVSAYFLLKGKGQNKN